MEYHVPASREIIQKTIAALLERGIQAELVEDRAQALAKLKEMIPAGSEVMTGASRTLEEIGFVEFLASGKHPWKNLKEAIVNEKDPAVHGMLRRQAALAEYFLGSVNAITETGELVIASASGSQISSYAYASPNVIWVAGVQKIVPTLGDALRRVREYVLPLEDARMKQAGRPGSFLGKILILEREKSPARTLRMILVNEALGF